jgi:hypothetical protein
VGVIAMTTPEERRRMATSILDFEARRNAKGHLTIYNLPAGDGGGRYEVAGINERYNKDTADVLVLLIKQRRFNEAEALAVDFIAQDTDRARSWTSIPAIEFYLRDSVFNRGGRGGARIMQRALGVHEDGVIGAKTRAVMALAETEPSGLLAKLRAAREQYERDVAHRDEASKFWKGLVNRWNKAIEVAKTFPLRAPISEPVLLQLVTPMPETAMTTVALATKLRCDCSCGTIRPSAGHAWGTGCRVAGIPRGSGF